MNQHFEASLLHTDRPEQFIGSRIQRTEDELLLKGQGKYVDDLPLVNVLYSAFLRSPHAHAKIISINIEAASKLSGVHKIYLHKDLPACAQKRVPLLLPNPAIQHLMMQEVLVSQEVCCVGDAIAFVVADNRYIAEDACALIEVDYEIFPAIADCLKALEPNVPSFHSLIPHNLAAQVKTSFG